jgi:replicative DNA helicase
MAAKAGLALLVVDYLQLVSAESKERRELAVASVSRGLKQLAGELQIPVIAVAQVNRAVEQRADKRPTLADLRESGSLEQDADVVLVLHREPAYDPDADEGAAELIVRKHRNGPTGTVPLYWMPQKMAFFDAVAEPKF